MSHYETVRDICSEGVMFNEFVVSGKKDYETLSLPSSAAIPTPHLQSMVSGTIRNEARTQRNDPCLAAAARNSKMLPT